MSDTLKIVLLMVSMTGITFVIRTIPMTLMRKKITSRFIKSLLYYIPYAVLSAMTFPFIFYSTGNLYAALIATAAALIAAVFKLSLILVALIACAVALVFILIL